MIERGTYGDPNPMVKNSTEAFYVYGVWNVAMTTLAKVNFTCMLMGVEVYTMDYACAGTGNDYGHCPGTTGVAGEDWSASFGFDVPAIAPPFEYDVTITAIDTSNNELFQLSLKFYIPWKQYSLFCKSSFEGKNILSQAFELKSSLLSLDSLFYFIFVFVNGSLIASTFLEKPHFQFIPTLRKELL